MISDMDFTCSEFYNFQLTRTGEILVMKYDTQKLVKKVHIFNCGVCNAGSKLRPAVCTGL